MDQQKIEKLQNLIKKNNLDGWLFYDFRGSNDLALSVLEIPAKAHLTRRFFYFAPFKVNLKKLLWLSNFTTWHTYRERCIHIAAMSR
ncbi:hypothetical protein MASR1M107_16690 [Ignavibacteriales bacterium]